MHRPAKLCQKCIHKFFLFLMWQNNIIHLKRQSQPVNTEQFLGDVNCLYISSYADKLTRPTF